MNIILSEGLRILPILIGVLAVVFVPFVSKVAEWFTTLIHEVGHGIIAVPFGGRVGGIHLHSDGSGHADTQYSGFFVTPVRIFSLLMGYAFPVYLGVSLLITAYYKNVNVGSWILGIIGLILLFSIRSWFGFLIVLVYEALFLYYFHSSISAESTIDFMVFAGFLFTIRGLIDIVMVGLNVFEDQVDGESDFHILEEEVFFPPKFWYIFFLVLHAAILTFFFLKYFPLTLSF